MLDKIKKVTSDVETSVESLPPSIKGSQIAIIMDDEEEGDAAQVLV